jgi:hypothetical protein
MRSIRSRHTPPPHTTSLCPAQIMYTFRPDIAPPPNTASHPHSPPPPILSALVLFGIREQRTPPRPTNKLPGTSTLCQPKVAGSPTNSFVTLPPAIPPTHSPPRPHLPGARHTRTRPNSASSLLTHRTQTRQPLPFAPTRRPPSPPPPWTASRRHPPRGTPIVFFAMPHPLPHGTFDRPHNTKCHQHPSPPTPPPTPYTT